MAAARFLHVITRLRQGVTLAQAETELAVLSQRLAKQYPIGRWHYVQVLNPASTELVHDVRSTLWLLLGAVGRVSNWVRQHCQFIFGPRRFASA